MVILHAVCGIGNFFFGIRQHVIFFFCVQLLGPSIFLALLLLRVSPPPKLSATARRAVRLALINALGESPLFNIGHGRTYICWGAQNGFWPTR